MGPFSSTESTLTAVPHSSGISQTSPAPAQKMQEVKSDKIMMMMMMNQDNMKPQPREERLRIPGRNQPTQLKTKCQPNIHLVPRQPLSYSRIQEDEEARPKTPRLLRTPQSSKHWPGKDEAGRRQLPLRKASLGSPASQESEASMGIIDCYLRDPSPSPLAISKSVALKASRSGSQERDQVEGAAIAAFDFGLSTSKADEKPSSTENEQATSSTRARSNTKPRFSKPLPLPPNSPRCQYTLFPKDLPSTPSTPTTSTPTPTTSIFNEMTTLQNSPIPPPPLPQDPARPRKASLASSTSLRSRSDSCTSIKLLPSATFTSPPPPTHPATTSKLPPRKPLRIRTPTQSSTTSLPSHTHKQQTSISHPPPSRWSSDTVSVPLTPPPISATSTTAESSFSSSASTAAEPNSPPYPTGSFFEVDDDGDDETLPLRKKVVEKILASRVKEIQPGSIGVKKGVVEGGIGGSGVGKNGKGGNGGIKGWTGRWLGCGCKRK